MDLKARLTELAKITESPAPVVSVYLNTRWADEHQRERERVFLKNEIRRARRAAAGGQLEEDLDWIRSRAEAIIGQEGNPRAHGVALFACKALGLREVLPVRVPFEEAFVVADAPFLRPLAATAEHVPSALAVFVDGESARLIPMNAEGAVDEVRLESEVPGHHRRGGWAQLAQSRYQRHIQDHRERHLEAVARVLTSLSEGNGVERIVTAGEPRILAALGEHLPQRIAERIVGDVPGTRYEPASAILDRAAALVARARGEEEQRAVDSVLTEAAKSRQAVAGLEEILDAVARGAIHRVYFLKGFNERGRACPECGALQREPAPTCRLCGEVTKPVELGEAIAVRVIAAGGTVETVEAHPGLARVGGVAALLRFPL